MTKKKRTKNKRVAKHSCAAYYGDAIHVSGVANGADVAEITDQIVRILRTPIPEKAEARSGAIREAAIVALGDLAKPSANITVSHCTVDCNPGDR